VKKCFLLIALLGAPAFAQHEHQMPMPMPQPQAQPQHEHMQHEMQMQHDAVADFLMQQASGTSTNPAAAPMHMSMLHYRGWMLMDHASLFAGQIVQTGDRGGDQLFATNWFMGIAERKLGPGHLMLRTMLSLEPLFLGKRGYPELFQTGETAHGQPLIDRQHPHDFFMELAAEYAVDVGNGTIGYVYAAPVGDPALGPVAFPHRISAMEIPQATLSHHLQDSTHIASRVLTIGAKRGEFGLGVSGFHGREPDENRWDIDQGRIDSWSIRGTWDPSPQWTAQISTGHLKDPEATEPGNIQRTTASATYVSGDWSSSLIWGHNQKHDHGIDGVTLESNLRFNVSNYVTGRLEIVDKDELLPGVFKVKALTFGYTKDLFRTSDLLGGVGGNVTAYAIPAELKSSYGDRPLSFYAFVRLRSPSMH